MNKRLKALAAKDERFELFLLFFDKLLFSKYMKPEWYFDFSRIGLFAKVMPYTQLNPKRLSNIYDTAILTDKRQIPGAFVECGVWRGGGAAVLAAVNQKLGGNRVTWLFDSFEGMPEATSEDVGEHALELANNRTSGKLEAVGTNIAPIDDVKRLFFKVLRLDGSKIKIVKGWFQNTLAEQKSEIGPIAILRIDGDFYESTKVSLDVLFDNVVEGGFVIVDDYNCFPGCQKAVDEFLDERNIRVHLHKVDHECIHFQKAS